LRSGLVHEPNPAGTGFPCILRALETVVPGTPPQGVGVIPDEVVDMRTILGLLSLLAGVFALADEAWVVVTLDRIEFDGNLVEWPRFKGNPIGFISVVGSGNVCQKLVWPWVGWYTIADEGIELAQETEGIPIFALPAAEMGPLLGIAIQFLGNYKYDWDHSFAPEALATLEEALRARLTLPVPPGLPGTPEGESGEGRVEVREAPYLDFTPHFQVVSPEAWASGTATYTVEVSERYFLQGETPAQVVFQYSIRRVSLPEGLRARVSLAGIKTVESGDSFNGEVFIQTRALSGFAANGAPLQRTARIPASGHYSMGDGEEKVLSVVLFEGEVRPFLYVEVMVWDEDSPSLHDQHDLLGGLFGLWLPWRLSNLLGGEKRLVFPKSTPDGEVQIYLRVELLS
jgi:hypothetical protein